MSSRMSISAFVIAIGVTVLIAVIPKIIFSEDLSVNDTQEALAVNDESMMMPGRNMTFGSTLENAKMHLMEAIMNLNEGNIKGAIMQLNMTDQGIKMHEKEMMEMMKIMKPNMSATVSKTQNESS